MANTVAFINGKGGCGKTTSIFHVAGVLSSKGEKVLVIDLDKQRNTTNILLMDSADDADTTVFDFLVGGRDIREAVKKVCLSRSGNTP